MHASNTCELENGAVKIDAEIENNVIINVKITGSIVSTPPDLLLLLEKHLRGVELQRKFVDNAVNVLYLLGAKSDDVTKEQLVELIMGLVKK